MSDVTGLLRERYGTVGRADRERFDPPRRPRLADDTPEQIADRRKVLTATLDDIPQDYRRGAS